MQDGKHSKSSEAEMDVISVQMVLKAMGIENFSKEQCVEGE